MADVLCDDEPVAVTMALREHSPSSLSLNGMTRTTSGRDEDLNTKNKILLWKETLKWPIR